MRAIRWELSTDDGPVPAAVPGCVHTDLLVAGRLDEPYEGLNWRACQWIGERDWTYRGTFGADAGERLELAAESLQGTVTLVLNGRELATHRTQHAPLAVDLTPAVIAGENVIELRFRAPMIEYRELEAERGEWPVAMPGVDPSVHLRQMACAFGWDWAPPLATVGIVGPLHVRPAGPKLAIARAATTFDGDAADLHVAAGGDDGEVTWGLTDHEGREVAAAEGREAVLRVDRPRLWWPRGHGGQPLYTLTGRLTRAGRTVAETTRRVGLRTVTLDTTPDDRGSAFTLVVNDRPVFCKGMNWTPMDQLLPRVTGDALRRRVADAADCGANMLRVWGGGVFEPAAFYDACDELGLLVWQDFPFACGMYPDAALADLVEAEARHQVARLAPHACLALFCGGNETVWFHTLRDGWRERVGDTGWGDGFYFELLPRVIGELAPGTPYVPNSPFGAGPDAPADAAGHGPQHLWDAWNREPAAAYRNAVPRFASEFGFCGPAAWATLDAAVGLDGRSPHDPLVVDRMKAVNGQDKLFNRLADLYDAPRDFDLDRWLIGGQLMQAAAVRTGVDWFRAQWPTCAGALLWQLHDCWPAVSWSLIDAAGRRKPAYFAARAACADRRLSFQPADGGIHLAAVNDTDDPMTRRETVRRHDDDGRVLAEWELQIEVPPRSVRWLPMPAGRGILVAGTGAGRAIWAEPPRRYPPAELDAEVCAAADGYDVRVTAGTFVHDLCLLGDRLHPAAVADSGLVTLLPGERHTFRVTGGPVPAAADVRGWPVLAALNDLPPAGVSCRRG